MTRRARFALAACVLVLLLLAAGAGAAAWKRHLSPTADAAARAARDPAHPLQRSGRSPAVLNVEFELGVSGPLRVIDPGTGAERFEVPGSRFMNGFAASDDGEVVAFGKHGVPRLERGTHSAVDRVEVWSLRDGRLIAGYAVPSLAGLAFTPDGRTLIEGRADGTIERRDIATGAISSMVAVRDGFSLLRRAGRTHLLLDPARDEMGREVLSLHTGARRGYLAGS
ncbi:MAG: hypothetical protein ACAI25_01500, partial [Planctomycetota bacterium]